MNEYLIYTACYILGISYFIWRSHIRFKEILSLRAELAKEKEKIRLLRKLNPEPKDENGWTFNYSPSTYFIGKSHKKGGGITICEMSQSRDDKADIHYYGHRIAKLLNDGYVTASPEYGRDMDVFEKAMMQKVPEYTPIYVGDEIRKLKSPLTEGKSKIKKMKDTGLSPMEPPPKTTKE